MIGSDGQVCLPEPFLACERSKGPETKIVSFSAKKCIIEYDEKREK